MNDQEMKLGDGPAPANGGSAPARAPHPAGGEKAPEHGWAPTANYPLSLARVKLGVLARIQSEASKNDDPGALRPPENLRDFDSRSDLVFYDADDRPVRVAYAIAAWS